MNLINRVMATIAGICMLLLGVVLLPGTVAGQTTNPVSDKNGNLGVGTTSPTAKVDIVASAGQSALHVANGNVVLSSVSVASGSSVPTDKTMVFVNSTGADAVRATVMIPAGMGQDGQMVYVTTNDPDGVSISYTDPTGAVIFNASVGTAVRFFRAGGTWHVEF